MLPCLAGGEEVVPLSRETQRDGLANSKYRGSWKYSTGDIILQGSCCDAWTFSVPLS